MQEIKRSQRFRILQRDGFACRYCGKCAPDVQLEVDHTAPRSLGGTNDDANLVTACFDCNRGKRNHVLPVPLIVDGDVWTSTATELTYRLIGLYRDIFAGASIDSVQGAYDEMPAWLIDDIASEVHHILQFQQDGFYQGGQAA